MIPPRALNIGSNTDRLNALYMIDTIVYECKKGERIQEKQRKNDKRPISLSFLSRTFDLGRVLERQLEHRVS